MSYLQQLHGLVIQQQAALHANDLDWFQELVRSRMSIQDDLATSGAYEFVDGQDLVVDIVKMDRTMEGMLHAMADRTMQQLRTLTEGERRTQPYRPNHDVDPRFCDAQG